MENKIIELEKSLFKVEYMNNEEYLDSIIDDDYLEIGKSGIIINKQDVIKEFLTLKENRNIKIYNYRCSQISSDIFLVNYITLSNQDKIYRTSIWKKEDNFKIIFHQASLLKEKVELIEY